MIIVVATPAGAPTIRHLLEGTGLPADDLTDDSLRHFLVLRENDAVIGAVGIDLLGTVALLRSLVVTDTARGCGFGKKLAAAAEALARDSGAKTLYLLTTTAERFFASLGYRTIPRTAAPPLIQETLQFRSLCPSTATLMAK